MKSVGMACFLAAGCLTADANVEVAKIENAIIRVSFVLSCGTYDIADKKTGELCIREAHADVGDWSELRTLTSQSGGNDPRVSRSPDAESANALLVTLKRNGERRSLVLGALRTSEFTKWATTRSDGKDRRLVGSALEARDPVGRRTDPDETCQPDDSFYYDFWNDRLVGKLCGADVLVQNLRPGEARMFAVHAAEAVPQFIATDRHVMQGALDLIVRPTWNGQKMTLSGTSRVAAGDVYRVILACNGFLPVSAVAQGAAAELEKLSTQDGLTVLTLRADSQSKDVAWSVTFNR